MRPWLASIATIASWMLVGATPAMKFARGAYPDQKIVLTEKSSKKISEQKGHVGSREKTMTTFSKTYRRGRSA